MPLWTLNNPPRFKNPGGKELVATERGWEDPDTGEVLVAISELTTKGGGANLLSVAFDAASYVQSDPVTIIVHFNEKVDVTAGATVEISWDGMSGNFDATAALQTGVYDVEFTATVPAEAGTMSIAGQTVSGTIVDNDGGDPAESLVISAAMALAAGEREVA